MSEYGLGAHPSPPDPRDWPLALAPLAAPLPSRFVSTGMGPVLDQGSTPMCVAYAHSGLKTWQEKREGRGVIDFDERWLYARCKERDGIAGDGTDGRTAMKVLRTLGAAPVGQPAKAPLYRIAAYYAVPLDLASLKTALVQFGPLTLGGAWYESWFRPVNGILPRPSGGIVGGHEVLLFGWDDAVGGGSLLFRNSWNRRWGVNGNAYAPVRHYLPALWEGWKAVDMIGGNP